MILAGCGGVSSTVSNAAFTIGSAPSTIDTNCTGCNATGPGGRPVVQFKAALANGEPAPVTWTLTRVNGDRAGLLGSMDASGQYTPPSDLTQDTLQVKVQAASGSYTAFTTIDVTPGFLAPISPENLALGANGSATITAVLAETGGSAAVHFALSTSPRAASGGQGALRDASCRRGPAAYTACSVVYTAPANISATGTTYVVANVGTSASRTSAAVLLNTAGILSSPLTHQARQSQPPMLMGASGGNIGDIDQRKDVVFDCCGGTLGALLKGSDGSQYLLGNNHVLARSDRASVGDTIVQPGLIDNNCNPLNSGAAPVASLTGFVPLSSTSTNVDAAIARVNSGAVDPAGGILELGARQANGTLAAAPPGISSTGGKGEAASLNLQVAKSGRTTGLTCAHISALSLDVKVDYFLDCAETRPYLTKTFTNQLGISGAQFSDAGDSGSLVVDASNAEPVGLYFAGGEDSTDNPPVAQGVANPASQVLSELSRQLGGGTTYTFVGGADHAVSCLNYGDSTIASAQARTLASAESSRARQALAEARTLVDPAVGILGVAIGKSNDHPGEAAVIVYVDETTNAAVPPDVAGVRTLVVPTDARAVASGSAPQTVYATQPLPAAALRQAIAVKQQIAQSLMRRNPAFFGVGVGQSLDNPKEAALVVYVDRNQVPAQLPQTIGGLRTRYIVMARLHVTRSYATPLLPGRRCPAKPSATRSTGFDLRSLFSPGR
jgi:hypothetical protein